MDTKENKKMIYEWLVLLLCVIAFGFVVCFLYYCTTNASSNVASRSVTLIPIAPTELRMLDASSFALWLMTNDRVTDLYLREALLQFWQTQYQLELVQHVPSVDDLSLIAAMDSTWIAESMLDVVVASTPSLKQCVLLNRKQTTEQVLTCILLELRTEVVPKILQSIIDWLVAALQTYIASLCLDKPPALRTACIAAHLKETFGPCNGDVLCIVQTFLNQVYPECNANTKCILRQIIFEIAANEGLTPQEYLLSRMACFLVPTCCDGKNSLDCLKAYYKPILVSVVSNVVSSVVYHLPIESLTPNNIPGAIVGNIRLEETTSLLGVPNIVYTTADAAANVPTSNLLLPNAVISVDLGTDGTGWTLCASQTAATSFGQPIGYVLFYLQYPSHVLTPVANGRVEMQARSSFRTQALFYRTPESWFITYALSASGNVWAFDVKYQLLVLKPIPLQDPNQSPIVWQSKTLNNEKFNPYFNVYQFCRFLHYEQEVVDPKQRRDYTMVMSREPTDVTKALYFTADGSTNNTFFMDSTILPYTLDKASSLDIPFIVSLYSNYFFSKLQPVWQLAIGAKKTNLVWQVSPGSPFMAINVFPNVNDRKLSNITEYEHPYTDTRLALSSTSYTSEGWPLMKRYAKSWDQMEADSRFFLTHLRTDGTMALHSRSLNKNVGYGFGGERPGLSVGELIQFIEPAFFGSGTLGFIFKPSFVSEVAIRDLICRSIGEIKVGIDVACKDQRFDTANCKSSNRFDYFGKPNGSVFPNKENTNCSVHCNYTGSGWDCSSFYITFLQQYIFAKFQRELTKQCSMQAYYSALFNEKDYASSILLC